MSHIRVNRLTENGHTPKLRVYTLFDMMKLKKKVGDPMELMLLVCQPESVVVLKVRHLNLRSVTVLLSFRNVTHTNRTWEEEEGTQILK